ncbi:MAG: hypothetical protein JXR07_08725 [Reichenbachiella sp.]
MTQKISDKNSAGRIIAIVSLLAFAYAILRYHIFGPVPWRSFPLFILNKGVSLAAFVLITFNFTLGPLNNITGKVSERWLNARKALGMTGFLYVLLHALISFMIFKPEIYMNFFLPDGTLTLYAGLSMLGGILGFVTLWGYNLSFQTHLKEDKGFIKFITSRKFLLVALTFGAVHLFFMGYKGWLTPGNWHGSLPPISLVAFVFFISGYLINLIGRK